MTVQQAFELASEHHRARRFPEAESVYRQILAHQPDYVPALENLARLGFEIGRFADAADLLRRAIALRPDSPDLYANLGMVLATAGLAAQAIPVLRQALALRARPEAYNNLANALQAVGNFDEALEAYQQCLRLAPNYADAHNNLAIVLKQKGRFDEAITHFRKSLELRPGNHEARYNLGLALKAVGRLDEAVDAFRQALEQRPDYAEAALELGSALHDKNDLDAAVAAFRQALQYRPNYPEAWYGIGNSLKLKPEYGQAIAAYQQALALRPDYAEAFNNLGNALKDLGRMDEALAAYNRAIELRPDLPEPLNNLGFSYELLGDQDQAIAYYHKALALRPNYAEALNNLANVFKARGQLDEAIETYHRAIEIDPKSAEAHNNLANAMKDTGRLDAAMEGYRRAIELGGGSQANSNLLFGTWAHPDFDLKRIWEEHVAWRDRFAAPLAGSIPVHSNDRSPDRRLRIGYVSPDLTEHPVGRFVMPLLANHDRNQFEVFCYSDSRRADAFAAQFRSLGYHWRDTFALSDEQLARGILEDRIDILVDLALHTAGNRMLVFARKPAPVQVTYLGYCGTTGLTTMDYRLSDAFFDPPGTDERYYSERTIRLPRSYYCYVPLPYAPPIGQLPALTKGHVTFGSLNNTWKASAHTLSTWWRLMRQVPGSKLVAHFHEGSQRQQVIEHAGREGIDQSRLEFVGRLPGKEYFAKYQEIDIALDPFPYPGGTTSCDAIWMGVPVVTLAGQTPVGRAGVSILSTIGVSEWIVHDREQYIQIASTLAADLSQLAATRSTLRDRMQSSPQMDVAGFTKDIEAAFRQMWRNG
ncbi:MAG TPA: tetratricopeptide repeat protein [Tepidisphaeraceae bacterium]|nr:tetratricopeptide repeat protein [Tepidisphaeraceae bacterium]